MEPKKHFYQKFQTWVVLSFLSGATVMVAAFALMNDTNTSGGLLALQAPQSVPVAADFIAPAPGTRVVIVQPAENDQFASDGIINISATASNNQGIQKMQILIDGQVVQTCLAEQCAVAVSVDTLQPYPSHDIQVQATGLDGTTGSAISTVAVQ